MAGNKNRDDMELYGAEEFGSQLPLWPKMGRDTVPVEGFFAVSILPPKTPALSSALSRCAASASGAVAAQAVTTCSTTSYRRYFPSATWGAIHQPKNIAAWTFAINKDGTTEDTFAEYEESIAINIRVAATC
ncbi:hypothetical protein CALVIDRAFT_569870 [Calocera viscosa TUFC12733]|uniref:Uncharacterized protein n=1 Tax=Calocera viscosa (strain TUFC12733) TaxID=1330018 RepID=A0A167FHH0_CALVF|nr:hypothetical protein CALVIDRAFT_569870 [Calocera viscosa TUFC12733]